VISSGLNRNIEFTDNKKEVMKKLENYAKMIKDKKMVGEVKII